MIRKIFIILFCHLGALIQSQNFIIAVIPVDDQNNEFPKLRVTLKERVEKFLVETSYVTLVDRDLQSKIENERRIQKSASFIDGYYVDQSKALGANCIIKLDYAPKDNKLKTTVINVETGAVTLIKEYDLDRFVNKSFNIERPDFFDRFLKEKITELVVELGVSFDASIDFINITQPDKNKAKRGLVKCNSACSLKKGEKLILYIKQNNTRVKIGEIVIVFKESNTVYECDIKDGQEAVFTHFNNKVKIVCYAEN